MAYRIEKSQGDAPAIVIDGFDKGISPSPYKGIANMRNVNATYYPGGTYVNYKRQAATISGGTIKNPLHKAISPAGIIYILDDTGQIWKQSAVASSTFNLLGNGSGRVAAGHDGLAYWNNYLVVFGAGYIEFCGKGTSDADITSSNWNVLTGPSTVTVTNQYLVYATAFTGIVTTGSTSATLTSAWQGLSGSYNVRFGNAAVDIRSCTFTNLSTSVTWTGGLTNDASAQFSMYQMTATNGTFSGSVPFLNNNPVRFSSSGSLPTGLAANTTYYLKEDVDLSGSTVFQVSSTLGGTFIPFTDAGSGTITMSLLAPSVPPIANTTISGFGWGTAGTGATTITLASEWLQASGTWNIVDTLGNNLLAVFTYLSRTVTLLSPAVVEPTGTFNVNILNTAATTYKTWVSKVDGNLYFANGRSVGRILSENTNITFNPGIPASYVVDYAATQLLQPSDSVVDMVDVKNLLLIAGNFDTYTWDYVSPNVSAPSPVGEQIVRVTNLLSNAYILAGTKGNIYFSNAFTNQLLTKIPDSLANGYDPIWSFGDIMVHRSKLWFQATAQTAGGTNVMAGIFSMIVTPSLLGESASGLVVEAQNSYGLTPNSGAKMTGVLVDYEAFSTGVDKYYSAWSNGSSTGGIDYNDTTLWGSNEPIIETDIIPIGTILEKRSLGNIEFKLGAPLATGDSVTLSWRPSLTDSYTAIKTTTDTVLSDYKQSDISQAQWAQFKVTMSCASSNSSYIPLREIRIHYN